MGKSTARTSEHPSHIWEAQRQHFTKLYKNEKGTLVEVQRLMQDEHGFYATLRQYKRKIKKRDLEKNSKATEKHHALGTLKDSNTELDVACVYKVNGKDIAAHKLLRYARLCHKASNTVRQADNRKRRAGKAPLQTVITSISFASDSSPICKKNGFVDLHELLASVVCFIWFEPWAVFDLVPRARSTPSFPKGPFLEWTKVVLMATQQTTNHVILAALYLYRLKSYNPTVIAKPGSEYRVTAVALMVANKFLDDNHYTNKTWAEVTGISIPEVHVMEIEFLSNMRYSLTKDSRSFLGSRQRISLKPSSFQTLPQRVPPAASDSEMHDLTSSTPQNITCSEMPEILAAALDDILYPEEHPTPYSIAQRDECPDMPVSLSNVFTLLDDVPTGVSGDAPDTEIQTASQVVKTGTVVEVNASAFEVVDTPFANLLPSPYFLGMLTMDLPTPVLDPEDILLEWRPIDLSELQEGPIPDPKTFLNSALWEDDSELSQLNGNSTLLLGQSDADLTPSE